MRGKREGGGGGTIGLLVEEAGEARRRGGYTVRGDSVCTCTYDRRATDDEGVGLRGMATG